MPGIPGDAGAPCVHGKPAVCRFQRGCRFGENCRYCHTCEVRTTYKRIQEALACSRDRSSKSRIVPASGTIDPCTNHSSGAFTLLQVVELCPELLFRGHMGQALEADSLEALSTASQRLSKLLESDGSLFLWRQLLTRFCGPRLRIDPALIASQPVGRLRRLLQALRRVRFKAGWQLSSEEELLGALGAIETASDASGDAVLWALSWRFSWRESRGRGMVLPEEEEIEDGAARFYVKGAATPADSEVRFRVVPAVWCRTSTDSSGEDSDSAGASTSALRCLRPVVVHEIDAGQGTESQLVRPNVIFRARLWSASPGLCAFEGLSLGQERPLSAAEAAALVGPPDWAAEPKKDSFVSFRAIVTVRCVQRFWELPVS